MQTERILKNCYHLPFGRSRATDWATAPTSDNPIQDRSESQHRTFLVISPPSGRTLYGTPENACDMRVATTRNPTRQPPAAPAGQPDSATTSGQQRTAAAERPHPAPRRASASERPITVACCTNGTAAVRPRLRRDRYGNDTLSGESTFLAASTKTAVGFSDIDPGHRENRTPGRPRARHIALRKG